MKSIRIVITVTAWVFLVGCAARVPVTETRLDNTITYRAETGHAVAVTVEGGYVYDAPFARTLKGVNIVGHLFKNGDGAGVVVGKMTLGEFKKLTGYALEEVKSGVKTYPPKTIYSPQGCQLIRAYVAGLEGDVVTAVNVRPLSGEKRLCGQWTTLDDVMAADMQLVTAFDDQADAAIEMTVR